MIQIALVDDDEAASNELQEKLQRFALENHEDPRGCLAKRLRLFDPKRLFFAFAFAQ